MDKTEQNIKMCGKAEEIQEEHNWATGDYCVFLQDYTMGHWCIFEGQVVLYADGGVDDIIDKVGGIWLPRQDQLQILSGLSWKEFDKECLKYDAETKEQAGIQVVIERLNKVWNGEEWLRMK